MYMTANSWFGMSPEATRGASVSPSVYIPITEPQVTNDQKWLRDEGLRGSPVMLYGDQAGVIQAKYSSKGNVFPSTFPNLLRAALGSTDTVASVGSLHSHTIGLFNSASVGSQPPSYSLVDFDGQFAYILTGSQLSKLTIDFKADGPMQYTADWLTNIQASVAPPSESFDSTLFVPTWNLAASVNGSSVTAIEEGTIMIDRKAAAVFTGGQQSAFENFAGPCDVSGKLTAVISSSVYDYVTNGLTDSAGVFNFLFALPGATQPSVQLRMSQCQLKLPVKKRGKVYLEVDVNFDAESNATDAVMGGYSPIWTQTINASGTAV